MGGIKCRAGSDRNAKLYPFVVLKAENFAE